MRATILFLGIVGSALLTTQARGQYYYNPYAAHYQMQMQQQMLLSQAYGGYGTGGYGFGYAQPFVAPVAPPSSYSSYSGSNSGSSMPSNPYLPSGPGYGVNQTYPSYYPGYNPFPYYGPGSILYGQADIMRGWGDMVNSREKAKLTREAYNQMRLDTRKKEIELEMYIKSLTPTYTQAKERDTKAILRRMQSNPTPGEITNGTALNVLLDDLRVMVTSGAINEKKQPGQTIFVSEATLNNINVSKGNLGLGILRDDGKVTWPPAVMDRMKGEEEKALREQIHDLVQNAANGKIDNAAIAAVSKGIEKVREELVKKVDEIPTRQYLDAKRFLLEFEQSLTAITNGEAPGQAKFRRFVKEGQSIQQVVAYMTEQGLRFGPATADSEQAYRVLYTSLASYNLAANALVGHAAADPKMP